MRWTEEKLTQHLAARKATEDETEHESDNTPESRLQARCEAYLTDKGYYYFHDKSRQTNAPGLLDLVIALPHGRTVWIELKSKRGRMRPEQKETVYKLMCLGHEVFAPVKSYKRFVEIIEGSKK